MSEPQSYAPPPNARIEILTFDDGAHALSISLRGVEGARAVDAASISAMHGARIRHEQLGTAKDASRTLDVGILAATTAIGMPVVTTRATKDVSVSTEHLQHALALKVSGVPEVWYLLAQSFNFRKALGPDAGYSSELNLRAFLKRLAAFAPNAAKDAYLTAMIDRKDLPPPVESLIDFLRTASK
ncbi:MAG TPA: hypothetical protein VEV38_03445 [Candidatus Eremiobacteraceae bacterium]|nr:hypothetical protein [Candidatus Eremiobacteraceae bacterium]